MEQMNSDGGKSCCRGWKAVTAEAVTLRVRGGSWSTVRQEAQGQSGREQGREPDSSLSEPVSQHPIRSFASASVSAVAAMPLRARIATNSMMMGPIRGEISFTVQL